MAEHPRGGTGRGAARGAGRGAARAAGRTAAAATVAAAAGWPFWKRSAAAALAGLGLALGQAPFSLVPVALGAAAVALFSGLAARAPRQAAWHGWLTGTSYGALSLFWITEPFQVDAARDGWLAPFALFFMAGGLGLFWAAAFWLAHRHAAGRGLARALVMLAVFWTGAEMLRSYAFTGFPWGLTSYLWIDTPVYQLAAFAGPHGLTLATVLCAAALLWAVMTRRLAPGLIAGGLVLAALAGGQWRAAQPDAGQGARPVVRLIQPNATQKQKWDPAMMPVFYNRQLALSAAPPAPGRPAPALVVWPEVAVPFLLSNPDAPFWQISRAAGGAPVVLGAQRIERGHAFNSLALLGPGGQIRAIYDKRHLVPFGEYIPARRLAAVIGLNALAAQYGSGYTPGTGARTLRIDGLGTALPLICYEAIFPHEIRTAPRPDFLLMLTNDGWFGTASGPYQHFAQARARTIETGLPMLRAANTGISAVIDARGRIVASLPLGVAGHVDAPLPAPLPPSIYWRLGDAPALLALVLLYLGARFATRANPVDRRQMRM